MSGTRGGKHDNQGTLPDRHRNRTPRDLRPEALPRQAHVSRRILNHANERHVRGGEARCRRPEKGISPARAVRVRRRRGGQGRHAEVAEAHSIMKRQIIAALALMTGTGA